MRGWRAVHDAVNGCECWLRNGLVAAASLRVVEKSARAVVAAKEKENERHEV